MAFEFDDKLIVVGSYAGADVHPAWLHNLRANPHAHVEIGTDAYDVQVREMASDERDATFARIVEQEPGFAGHQSATERVIPVVELQRLRVAAPRERTGLVSRA